jgi:hypothetical protein
VTTGRDEVEVRLPAPATIEGTLVGEDGKPAPKRRLLAVSRKDRDRGGVTAETDDSGRFRLVGVGESACRIELVSEDRAWDPVSGTWPLLGGDDAEPGTKDLALRIPGRAATTISGRVVDDSGKPFADCVVLLHGSNSTTHHSCDMGGASFSETGVAPGKSCLVEVCCAGLRWQLQVPAGTDDLVVTAGHDGLHRVEFGGRRHEALDVKVAIVRAGERFADWTGTETRLVHATNGTVRAGTKEDRDRWFGERAEFRLGDLPVGPWRVEIRSGPDGTWRPCRAGTNRGDAVLIFGE